MKQLKADKNRMVLNADKGAALVVMDRSDYIRKAKELLDDTSTYRTIQSDPTNKLKNKLINIFKRIKVDTGMQKTSIGECTLQRPVLQNFMGSQKYIRRMSP